MLSQLVKALTESSGSESEDGFEPESVFNTTLDASKTKASEASSSSAETSATEIKGVIVEPQNLSEEDKNQTSVSKFEDSVQNTQSSTNDDLKKSSLDLLRSDSTEEVSKGNIVASTQSVTTGKGKEKVSYQITRLFQPKTWQPNSFHLKNCLRF